jgi:hypothetical protein
VKFEYTDERRTPRSRVVLLILLGAAIGLIGLGVWLLLGAGLARAAGGVAVIGVGWALGLFSPALADWLLRKLYRRRRGSGSLGTNRPKRMKKRH